MRRRAQDRKTVRVLRNLPVVPPDFVGRREELAHLDGALRQQHVVTLTGAGGVGKSRLALQAADGVLSSGARGVAWADLWPLRDDRLLVASVADAVDFSDHTTDGALDSLVDWLADRDVLLVLDSCEHLVGPCRRLVARLVLACPRLTVLATSREPLGVPGEHVVAVGPLPPATDALEMFRLRAAAAGSPLSAPADLVAAARLCQRLEGMPLAVELIAGQLARRTVEEVDLELGLRLDITADGVPPGRPATGRCGRRSAGATNCAHPRNACCGHGCRCSGTRWTHGRCVRCAPEVRCPPTTSTGRWRA